MQFHDIIKLFLGLFTVKVPIFKVSMILLSKTYIDYSVRWLNSYNNCIHFDVKFDFSEYLNRILVAYL